MKIIIFLLNLVVSANYCNFTNITMFFLNNYSIMKNAKQFDSKLKSFSWSATTINAGSVVFILNSLILSAYFGIYRFSPLESMQTGIFFLLNFLLFSVSVYALFTASKYERENNDKAMKALFSLQSIFFWPIITMLPTF
jgi:hypothetical protein